MKKLFYLYFSAFIIALILTIFLYQNQSLYTALMVTLMCVLIIINDLMAHKVNSSILSIIITILILLFLIINYDHITYQYLIISIFPILISTYRTYQAINNRNNQ